MNIGIDMSVLQTGHRMRGIGYTLINFINNIPDNSKQDNSFVFYLYDEHTDDLDPLSLLDLDGINFEVRRIDKAKVSSIRFPKKLKIANSIINAARKKADVLFGDSRIKNLKGVDWFLQFDQSQPLPSRRKVKSSLILYDLIQYILEYEYLPSYRTARLKGHSRKGALRSHFRRYSYASLLKHNTKRAVRLLAISSHTKRDFVHFLGVPKEKISVCLLGVNSLVSEQRSTKPSFKAYRSTSWGDFLRPVSISQQSFLLFVGGADPRRKLSELVSAFNNLRARGVELKLILAGDTMLGPNKVPNIELQDYLKHSSYIDDIYFLGFVNDHERDWLYKNALAFVYPSVYEGFGLPIIEAMQYGTPVITYKNSSIEEVAGSAAIFVDDYSGICDATTRLISDAGFAEKYRKSGLKQSGKFTWKSMSIKVLKSVGAQK